LEELVILIRERAMAKAKTTKKTKLGGKKLEKKTTLTTFGSPIINRYPTA
jgi:hypothetical protein